MDEGLLSLKWNNHKPAFAHLLKVLRQKGCYTDVTLACGNKFFEVHRLVLIACSDFFTKVFDRITCQKPVIVLNEVKSQELEALLDYMYLGEVDVQQKHLPGLIKAAEYLLIKGLAVPDEDPLQTSNSNKSDDGAERPTKRRRQDRDSRDSERPTERGSHNTYADQQYLKTSTSDAEIIEEGTSSNKRLSSHVEKDKSFEVDLVDSDKSKSPGLPQDSHSSLNRVQQTDALRNVEKKKNNDTERNYDPNTQNQKTSFNEESIKTEQFDDISEIEEIDNSVIKTELDIRNQNVENSSGDFSHFLSSNVDSNLTSHMFESPHHQAGPGPSGLQGHMGLEAGISEGIGDDGRVGGSGGELFPSHLMAGDVLPDGAAGSQMGSNGGFAFGPGGHGNFFSQDVVAQHRCPYCPQTFMFYSILKRHLRTHTGEKPFQCPHCDYRSAYKYHVVRHMKMHTNSQDQGSSLTGFPSDVFQTESESNTITQSNEETEEASMESISISRSDIQ